MYIKKNYYINSRSTKFTQAIIYLQLSPLLFTLKILLLFIVASYTISFVAL